MASATITLEIATTVDGYIAEPDGGVAFLEAYEGDAADPTLQRYLEEFLDSVDALVMGSRTYEQARSFGDWPYGERPTYVLTARSDREAVTDAVRFVDEPADELAAELRETYDRVWLLGGAATVGSFLAADAIGELRLTVVPTLLGDGIRLFDEPVEGRTLETRGVERYENGIVQLRYAVGK